MLTCFYHPLPIYNMMQIWFQPFKWHLMNMHLKNVFLTETNLNYRYILTSIILILKLTWICKCILMFCTVEPICSQGNKIRLVMCNCFFAKDILCCFPYFIHRNEHTKMFLGYHNLIKIFHGSEPDITSHVFHWIYRIHDFRTSKCLRNGCMLFSDFKLSSRWFVFIGTNTPEPRCSECACRHIYFYLLLTDFEQFTVFTIILNIGYRLSVIGT